MSATPAPDHGPHERTQPLTASFDSLSDGRYRLGARLGAGGMGLVLRAADDLLGRDVAVKLLADNLAADADARERFLREARAAARIVDPHVVAVFDVGEEGGRPYLVMELVDGPSLADVLDTSGPLDPDEVARVARDALTGLSRAHAAGLLHRDVKPGNLLRTPDGSVKVTDFGVAEAADAPGLTRTGLVIGTRSYLAPERRNGRPATPATDLYALGVTLTQLLTGDVPQHHATGPALPAGTPAGLRRLVPTLLAQDPRERPDSAAEALAVLAGDTPTGTTGDTALLPANAPAGPAAKPDSQEATPQTTPGTTTPDLTVNAVRYGSSSGRHRRPLEGWVAVTIGAGVLALLVALLAQPLLVTPDDAGARTQQSTQVPRVEDDPAQTARHLAEWLREQGAR